MGKPFKQVDETVRRSASEHVQGEVDLEAAPKDHGPYSESKINIEIWGRGERRIKL